MSLGECRNDDSRRSEEAEGIAELARDSLRKFGCRVFPRMVRRWEIWMGCSLDLRAEWHAKIEGRSTELESSVNPQTGKSALHSSMRTALVLFLALLFMSHRANA